MRIICVEYMMPIEKDYFGFEIHYYLLEWVTTIYFSSQERRVKVFLANLHEESKKKEFFNEVSQPENL